MILGPIKLVVRIFAGLMAVIVLYFAVTFIQVWLRGQEHTTKNADAILVFGTAQLNGVPSPELEARLSHALALYRGDRAHFVVVTGGKKPGDLYTEAGVSATWLIARGVPKTDVILGGGSDTWENVATAAPAMGSHGIQSVITVTDPFHEYRAMAITSAQGFVAYPSPVKNSAVFGPGLWRYYAKETLEVGVARFVGYQQLSNWFG